METDKPMKLQQGSQYQKEPPIKPPLERIADSLEKLVQMVEDGHVIEIEVSADDNNLADSINRLDNTVARLLGGLRVKVE